MRKNILLIRLYVALLVLKLGRNLVPKEFEKTKGFLDKLDFKAPQTPNKFGK